MECSSSPLSRLVPEIGSRSAAALENRRHIIGTPGGRSSTLGNLPPPRRKAAEILVWTAVDHNPPPGRLATSVEPLAVDVVESRHDPLAIPLATQLDKLLVQVKAGRGSRGPLQAVRSSSSQLCCSCMGQFGVRRFQARFSCGDKRALVPCLLRLYRASLGV